jgi:hypothetical protein
MTPEEMLDAVRENASYTVDLLSSARKAERERVRAPPYDLTNFSCDSITSADARHTSDIRKAAIELF